MKTRVALVFAAVTLGLTSLEVNSAAATTIRVNASGGWVSISASIKDRTARTCNWSSRPKIPGFNATDPCQTRNGKVIRSAHFNANTTTRPKIYAITLTIHGKTVTLDHWKVIEAARATPPTTTTTTSTTTTTTVPGSGYLLTWPRPPACPTSAADADVCDVAFLVGGTFQVSAGENILFNIGWADATEQSCDAYASNTTTTMTIAGQAVEVVSDPCQFVASGAGISNLWVFDARYLSPPLPPGTYSASAVIVIHAPVPYTTDCPPTQSPCSLPAGTETFPVSVTVS